MFVSPDGTPVREPFADVPASEFRGATLSLYLQLVRLYLSGDRVTNAIQVLETLNQTDLPRGKNPLDPAVRAD